MTGALPASNAMSIAGGTPGSWVRSADGLVQTGGNFDYAGGEPPTLSLAPS